MKAEANPNKINNKFDPAVVGSRASMGAVMSTFKKTPSSQSSSASSSALYSIDHARVKELYHQFEVGSLQAARFKQELSSELGIKAGPNFERILADPTRTYRKVIGTFEVPKRQKKTPEFYNSTQGHKVISSTSLTTVGNSPSKDVTELKNVAQAYASGNINSSQFEGYLRDKNIPVSLELQRHIREHEYTKSVPFYKFTKCLLNETPAAMTNSTINKNTVYTDEVSKHKSKVEMVNREYDKIGNGNYITHKKKAEPRVKDNGEIFNWGNEGGAGCKQKNLGHLDHHDIFHWNRGDMGVSKQVVRKAPAIQRAALSSGNILNWQD